MHIRLRDCHTGTYYVVDTMARAVYADRDDSGCINRTQRTDPALAERALASASEYAEYFVRAIPGTRTPDGNFSVRGPLAQAEARQLEAGDDVPSERDALRLHLDFFDADLDGRITLTENYRGWRALGFSRLGAVLKSLFAALFFHGPTIEIDRIAAKRYSGSGIFDRKGGLDEVRLAPYLAEFDGACGELSFDDLFAALDRYSSAGVVSRQQFRSLLAVCSRLNGNRNVITKAQFIGLFDGSLLWLAASMTDNAGRRARWLQPASKPA